MLINESRAVLLAFIKRTGPVYLSGLRKATRQGKLPLQTLNLIRELALLQNNGLILETDVKRLTKQEHMRVYFLISPRGREELENYRKRLQKLARSLK